MTIFQGDVFDVSSKMKNNTYDGIISDPPYGLSFMGKKWDHSVPSKKVWKMLLKKCKPGAYLMAFGGTRTYHRLVCAIEDAGWKIKDTLCWLYGQGFPKSHNIGKYMEQEAKDGSCRKIKRKGIGNLNGNFKCFEKKEDIEITNDWKGYGTALKPSVEFIVLAQKPIEKNYVSNCKKYGCGGMNIDGSRIGEDNICSNLITTTNSSMHFANNGIKATQLKKTETHIGRWPANLILDEEAGKMLDEQSGKTGAFAPVKSGQKGFGGEIYGKYASGGDDGKSFYGDGLAGASRFFYCPKCSTKERNLGCEDLEEIEVDTRSDVAKGSFTEKGISPAKNNHPCIKPIDLCRYLANLIKPPTENSKILVPFSGSGSEMLGCLLAGWTQVDGIELDQHYIDIANKRIASIDKYKALLEKKYQKVKTQVEEIEEKFEETDLFGEK